MANFGIDFPKQIREKYLIILAQLEHLEEVTYTASHHLRRDFFSGFYLFSPFPDLDPPLGAKYFRGEGCWVGSWFLSAWKIHYTQHHALIFTWCLWKTPLLHYLATFLQRNRCVRMCFVCNDNIKTAYFMCLVPWESPCQVLTTGNSSCTKIVLGGMQSYSRVPLQISHVNFSCGFLDPSRAVFHTFVKYARLFTMVHAGFMGFFPLPNE